MLSQHPIVIYPSLTAFLQDVHCAFPLGGVDDAKCRSSSSSWELLLFPHSFSKLLELFHGRRSRLGHVLCALPFTYPIFSPLCQRDSLPIVFALSILVMRGSGVKFESADSEH
jgi:hypothetical protein